MRRLIGKFFGTRAPQSTADGPPGENHNRSVENGAGTPTDPLMRDGVARHLKGDLEGAEVAYRAVLDEEADHVDALHLLGNVLGQRGHLEQASALLKRALELNPRHPSAMVDLGNVHRASGDPQRAMECYQGALGVSPDDVAANRNLGYLQLESGQDAAGLKHLKAAVAAEPDVLQDQFTLAEVMFKSGARAEAIPHYAKTVELKPDLAVAHYHLAYSLSDCGSYDEALKHYGEAIALDPNDYRARNDYAVLLQKFARYEAAIEELRKTIELNPEFPGGYVNLGNVYRDLRKFAQARRYYEKGLEVDPDNFDAHNNLGTVLKDQGRVAEGTEHVRRAIELGPNSYKVHSNLLMNLQYMDGVSIETLEEAHADWVRCQIGDDVRPASNHPNSRDTERALRIGYLSPNLGTHPVGLFLEPVLEAHDESRVHVTCYADLEASDAVTDRIKLLVDQWRPIAGRADEDVAETIHSDGIDILVDLAGHTANNRMRLFAHKPAPVQATWIGYLHSTGLSQIDYLIADAVTVPEDTRQRFSEKVVRLPQCFLCYGQPENRPAVSPPPVIANGFVTFGCHNNLAKLSDGTLSLWKKILKRTADSRLLLKSFAFNDAQICEEYMGKLDALGFDVARVILQGPLRHGEYFASYGQIDIALDPFPFSGGTISVDALWMGVPVVTLAGDRMASRTSASILTCLGLDSLVTFDGDSYVNAAVSLAEDPAGLASLRQGMRARFAQTALGKPEIFTANLETAYRQMWQEWCRRNDGPV